MNRKVLQMLLIVSLMSCRASETQLFHHAAETLPPDPKAQASDLTADQLIAKYAAARGGEAKLKSLQSVKMTGTWESKGKSSPIVVMIAPGRYLRRIEQGSTMTMANVVDGPTTWMMNPGAGVSKPLPMSGQEAGRFRRLADPQGPLFEAKAKGNKMEVVGKLTWGKTPVYKLKVTFGDGAVTYYYLDAASFLPARIVGSQYVPQLNKNIDVEVIYGDYRDAGGVKWPFTEKANAPEVNFSQSISWDKIETNKPLDEAAFKPPKG